MLDELRDNFPKKIVKPNYILSDLMLSLIKVGAILPDYNKSAYWYMCGGKFQLFAFEASLFVTFEPVSLHALQKVREQLLSSIDIELQHDIMSEENNDQLQTCQNEFKYFYRGLNHYLQYMEYRCCDEYKQGEREILDRLKDEFPKIIKEDPLYTPTPSAATLIYLGAHLPPYELQWRKVGSKWLLFADDPINRVWSIVSFNQIESARKVVVFQLYKKDKEEEDDDIE